MFFFRLLKKTNENRKQIDVKIAKGTVTRLDMMEQLKFELKIFDIFLKIINVGCLLFIITFMNTGYLKIILLF